MQPVSQLESCPNASVSGRAQSGCQMTAGKSIPSPGNGGGDQSLCRWGRSSQRLWREGGEAPAAIWQSPSYTSREPAECSWLTHPKNGVRLVPGILPTQPAGYSEHKEQNGTDDRRKSANLSSEKNFRPKNEKDYSRQPGDPFSTFQHVPTALLDRLRNPMHGGCDGQLVFERFCQNG